MPKNHVFLQAQGYLAMEQKGMTFEYDFCYFILLFSSLLKKEGREMKRMR